MSERDRSSGNDGNDIQKYLKTHNGTCKLDILSTFSLFRNYIFYCSDYPKCSIKIFHNLFDFNHIYLQVTMKVDPKHSNENVPIYHGR